MDKHDDKWVDVMREKLEGYSPSYNAAHWAGLAGKLPAANAGGHGWLLSKLLPYSKVILISSVVVITTVVSLIYYNAGQNGKSSLPVMQQKDTSEVILNPVQTDTVMPGGQTESEKTGATNEVPEARKKSSWYKEDEDDIPNTDGGALKSNERTSERTAAENENRTSGRIPAPGEVRNDAESQMTADEMVLGIAGEDLNADGVQPETGTTQKGTNSPLENEENASLLQKLRGGGLERTGPVKSKKIRLSGNRPAHVSDVKMKKAKYEKPFFIGISYSGAIMNDEVWYPHKYQNMLGVSIEKYIFRNFSVSFNPRVSFNSIYKKYEDGTLPGDSLIYTAAYDSLWMPVPPDSSVVYPGKLSFVDLPVIFSYDILSHEKCKLSASAGIISRYTFSLQKDDLSDELKYRNNKFSFLGAGRVSLRYNRAFTDKLFFEVEPYWEFPLKKEPDIFNSSCYGFNLYLKFRMH